MNVIIIIRKGFLDTPILIKDNTTAQAKFDSIAEKLLGDDVSEINLHTDTQLDDLNSLVKHMGIEVVWFEGVDVNKYIN